jgi:shikimate kinase
MQYVVMTVGKTHAGKTTFGWELKKRLKNCCVIDSDEIAIFLRKQFPELYDSKNFRQHDSFCTDSPLRMMALLDVYEYAIHTNATIILTNVNSTRRFRKKESLLAHKAGRKVIMVYFNRTDHILLDRIRKGNRSKACLHTSKTFEDLLLKRQRDCFEAPDKKEADIFLEITDNTSWKEAQKKILALVSKSK